MKLLLVDDERYVIESIKKNICWERTGITEIYTAFTMKQAQEIITAVKMDIIISDIVMPAATGFDLVQWVREQNFRIQVIFLTSYAEFDYARRAIQLESVEYLLKPIDFEKLEEALKKAEQAVLQEKQIEKLTEASEQWEKDRTILQKDIWRNMFRRFQRRMKRCLDSMEMNSGSSRGKRNLREESLQEMPDFWRIWRRKTEKSSHRSGNYRMEAECGSQSQLMEIRKD